MQEPTDIPDPADPPWPVIKINAITVPADSGDELARRFAARAGAVDGQDGFEGFELLHPPTTERRGWSSPGGVTRQSFQAWVDSPAFGHGHQGADRAAPSGARCRSASELWSYVVAGGSAA